MRMIVGTAKTNKTIAQVRAGEVIEFAAFDPSDKAEYTLTADGEVVDVNPGNLMELQIATVTTGDGAPETCYARYMPGLGTVIVRIE